jgi:hypothetical protein
VRSTRLLADALNGDQRIGTLINVALESYPVWSTPARSLCTVTDCGSGFEDPLTGYLPGQLDDHIPGRGLGLWLARQVGDHIGAFKGDGFFTVRIVTQH